MYFINYMQMNKIMGHFYFLAHRQLLEVPVTEDERAQYFWSAPWALMVIDDSPQASVEYVNAAMEQTTGSTYLELFGTPSSDVVAPGIEAQVGPGPWGIRCGQGNAVGEGNTDLAY